MNIANNDKLQAILANAGVMRGAEWRQRLEHLQEERESGVFEVDKVVAGELIGGADSGFYLVQQSYGLDTAQGAIVIGAALEVLGEHAALSANDDELREFDPRTALFIDTETTGLAGGAGSLAFLVGVGYFTDDGFRLDQCFLRDYDDEEAMLVYLADIFRKCKTIVSYNGKTFDLPLLHTRFIQNRIPFPLNDAMHLDLLHAARRFWKRRLGSCSLGNVEREILGIERHGDVPGYEIPQIWFDYLRTRDARRLGPVFYHHKMDILSLAALTGWLAKCLREPHGRGFEHSDDRLSLARVYYRQKKFEEAASHAERLLEETEQWDARKECLELLADSCKRLGDFQRWESTTLLLLQENPRDFHSRIALAKHYEHRTRNLVEAERLCNEVLQNMETRAALSRETEDETATLNPVRIRLERIRRKLNLQRLGAIETDDLPT